MSIEKKPDSVRSRRGAVKSGREPPRKSARTRKKILEAAAKLFREQGYSGTSLRQIAKRARIEAASVYYYFQSKEEILDEVLELGIRFVRQGVEGAVDGLPAGASERQKIEAAIRAHLYALLKYSDYTSANISIFGQVSRQAQDRNRQLRRDYADYWSELFVRAQKAGEIAADADLSMARLLLLGAVNWSTQWYDPKKKPIDDLARAYCDILFDGIGAG